MRLRDAVADAIRDHALWEPGDRVAIGVSGGVDSVALLDALVATAGRHRGVLSVATVDHGVRPDAAEESARVAALAASYGLPCRVLAVRAEPTEAALRDARYAALESLDVDRIAVAHHRDDQAETALLALLRGSGTRGLAGMAWRRDRVVRPMLGVSRASIERYAAERGLAWKEDPTNADPRFLRNALRARVLPVLEELRPGVSKALARSATLAAMDADLLDALAVAPDALTVDWVRATPEPLVRRVLLRLIPDASAAHVDAVLDAARRGSGSVRVSDAMEVRIVGDAVVLGPTADRSLE